MSKKKRKKRIHELMDSCVSANECTGLLQKISVDPEEVAEFHSEYIEDDGRE